MHWQIFSRMFSSFSFYAAHHSLKSSTSSNCSSCAFTEEEEENASYVDLDLWMGYFIEVLCYNNPLMSACSRGA